MHEPSVKVLKTVVRKDWKIGSGYVDRNVTLLVTPRVMVIVLYCIVLEYIRIWINKSYFKDRGPKSL